MASVQHYWNEILNLIILYTPKLVTAALTLVVGLWAIRIIGHYTEKALVKGKVEKSLQSFLLSIIRNGLKLLLLISVASMVGIATTSFVAILGAAGLAVGLALQGSLANFAGGVLILLLKPFKVGDVIQAQGFTGKVESIQIFNTILKTPDNKTIIIPNGALSNDSILNFSIEEKRRIDFTFGIGYDDDLKKAKEILHRLVESDDRILKEPAPQIVIAELADSSVNIAVRVWCKAENYWGIYFDMLEKVKLTFDAEGISIPYPQHDVHLYPAPQA